jgi:hypothetical protein
LKSKFKEILQEVDHFSTPGITFLHSNRHWKISIVIVTDLPAGLSLHGFAHYYHPSASKCKCIYCGAGHQPYKRPDGQMCSPFSSQNGNFPLRDWATICKAGVEAEASSLPHEGCEVLV